MKKKLALILITGYAVAQYNVVKLFKRFDPIRKTTVLDLPHQEVSFESKGMTLVGNLFGENKKGLLVFSHGLGLNSDDYYGFTKVFVEDGYQVLAFDNTGTYRSHGRNTVGLNQGLVDLQSALDWVLSNPELDTSRLFLCGHSWGGYAVAAILNNKKYPIDGIISIAGSNSAMELIKEKSKEELNGWGQLFIPFTTAYHIVTFRQNFFKTAVHGLNKSQIPALIVHGACDSQVELLSTSIYAHRNSISNPNVQYFIRQEKEHCEHNAVFEDKLDSKKVDPTLTARMLTFLEEIK